MLPMAERDRHWIYFEFAPPCTLVALGVKLAMVHTAQRTGELI